MLLEYYGAPIENILSKTTNMHPFCGNERKKPTFHVDLIEFDHKTIPDFRFFFQYLFHWSKNASGVLGAPVETFLSRTTNLCRFCRNEEKETYFSRLVDCI